MTTKERIHLLVDQLPDGELGTVERVLAGLAALANTQSIVAVLAECPEDDEPVSAEEASAIQEAEQDVELGQTLSAADARSRLGL